MQCILFNSTLRLTSLPSQHPLQPIVRRAAKRNVKRHKTALHHLVHGLAIKPCKTKTISSHTVHPTALTPFLTQIAVSKEDAISDFARCQTRTMIFCQDRFSRSETDADGGAKVLGERVGSGSYYSRVVRAEAKRVRVEE